VNALLSFRISIQSINDVLDLFHHIAGGADDNRGGAFVGNRNNAITLFDALALSAVTLTALIPASAPSEPGESASPKERVGKATLISLPAGIISKKLGQQISGGSWVGVFEGEDF